MRVFLARSTGTDTWVTEPITPYVSVETGETVTTVERWDGKRPDCTIVGMARTQYKLWRNREVWLVIAADMDAKAQGTIDLGDPLDPTTFNEPLAPGEQSALENEFNLAPGTLDGVTKKQLARDVLGNLARHRTLLRDVVIELGSEV